MARADLLLALVRAGSVQDQRVFRRAVEALIAEERNKKHEVLARDLELALRSSPDQSRAQWPSAVEPEPSMNSLLLQTMPDRQLDHLVLPAGVRSTVDELVEEHFRRDLLRSYGFEPRHRILLTGPPGSGKTSLAEALASKLMIPLLAVRYEGLIGSYLGETASRLDRLFDHARKQECVLFFDEFDTVAKERGDTHETGEIKRVVSSLLLQVDQLPSHVLVIAATNHKELLDRAVWRRMQLRLSLPGATRESMVRWLEMHMELTGRGLGLAPRTIADAMKGASLAELEELALDIERRSILEGEDASLMQIARSRLTQWSQRAKSGESE